MADQASVTMEVSIAPVTSPSVQIPPVRSRLWPRLHNQQSVPPPNWAGSSVDPIREHSNVPACLPKRVGDGFVHTIWPGWSAFSRGWVCVEFEDSIR